ncbi:GbsR/MarR family transcriptional regulator [Ancylobacter mangrovi]|uniref:GbsR/MarR family transcriptional regulator n=1 Tax=Ancylobacter mangrovi TaxID=2972472 RepID=UPI0021618624|nr:GbsR/MarR family transcriptional regulator [Ancylobacter mangrovi]MCS0501197.1 GbsR/MarR family transcriptional regulator [Ancylobacter mangrovi]
MNLPPLIQSFVLHFGEMGSRWGINRTVGQIYALLYVSPEPLCAEDIVEALGLSRSNVSMGLRELQAWNLVVHKHLPDDRRDFFTTPDDVWQILRTLAEERKKREVDPTLSVLREILMQPAGSDEERFAQGRIAEMHGLIDQLTTWYDDVKRLETERLANLLSLGAKITRLLEAKDRVVTLGCRRPKAAREAGDTRTDVARAGGE